MAKNKPLIKITRKEAEDIAKGRASTRAGVTGDVGLAGKQGDKGDKGLSIKGDRGDTGLSIKGDKGDKGDSIKGDKGDTGVGLSGKKGDTGDTGLIGEKPDHQWKGTKLAFEKPDGKMGKFMDLQGRPGQSGDGAAVGGSIAADLLKLRDVNADNIADGEGVFFDAATQTFIPGAGGGGASGPSIKTMTLERPATNDLITWFFTDTELTVSKLNYIVTGGTSVSVSTLFNSTRSILGATALVTLGNTVLSSVTGIELTTFDVAVIPANSWVVVVITAAVGIPDEFHATMKFS